MDVYHFSENPYPDAWDKSTKSLRVTLPNRHFDPAVGAELINRYLDEWMFCDEVGLNIMVNEHHSTATCVTSSCMLPLAILARQTKKARLISLGVPLGIRADPIQVAEELSYIDVVSRGRLEMGFVKGFPTEVAPANVTPSEVNGRFWEAHDLILKAMTCHDGPFNWEGDYFHFRQVNIWPRPFQQPHPTVWTTAFSGPSAAEPAERGMKIASGQNAAGARGIFSTYRRRAVELGRPVPGPETFGYHILIGVGDTEDEGHRRVKQIKGYLETNGIVKQPFNDPPGFAPISASVQAIRRGQKALRAITTRDGRPISYATASIPELIEAGACVAGTPDQVFEQLKDLHNYVGGLGNIFGMMQGGHLSHADTLTNLTLFSREVLPRLHELKAPETREMEELELAQRRIANG